jgi:predicted acylesterase/phospholipase RssA
LKVFGIFEGGGVRGYAHVGALRALERRNVTFEAVAGTSIGAIVAALVAAGYRPDELYREDEEGVAHGIAAVGIGQFLSALDLGISKRVHDDLNLLKTIDRWCRQLRLPSLLDIRRSGLLVAMAWIATPLIWALSPLGYLRHRQGLSRLWRRFGLAETATARAWLDNALRQKLTVDDPPRPLVFGDLPIPLRVIVGDVKSGAMRVAGADKTEPLVDAVLASASFPLFFAPDGANGTWLVDGGIVSNLPAWVFDRERAASSISIPTIALRLVGEDKGLDRALHTLARFLPRLAATILNGARELQFRRIDDHHLIALPAEIDVLAFHEMEAKRSALVEAGDKAVEAYFETHFGPVDPQRAATMLALVAAHTRQVLATPAVVRAWVLMGVDEEYVRVAYAANMGQDADDQLVIRRGSPGAACVFERKEPVLVNIPDVAAAYGSDPLYKYEHAVRARSVKTVCALPIFADPMDWLRPPDKRAPPIAVLGLDLDEDSRLAFVSEPIEDRMATYAQIVGECLRDRVVARLQPAQPARSPTDNSTLWTIAPGVEVYQRKTRALVFDADTAQLIQEARAA